MPDKVIMPDDMVQSCHDNEGMDAQSKRGFKSVWMAHWMHTSDKSATQDRNHLSIDCESKREVKEDSGTEQHNVLGGPDVAIDKSTNAGSFGETKATTVTFMNENLTANTGKSKIESLDLKSFPKFNISEKRHGILSLKREQYAIYHGEVLKSQTDASFGENNVSLDRTETHLPSTSVHVPPKVETLSRECHLWSEGFLPTNLLMKSPDAIENKSAVSTSQWNDFAKSTADMVPYAYNKGKTSTPSFTSGQREIYQSSYNLASREHFTHTNYHSCSSLFIREKKMGSVLDRQRSWFSRLMQSGPALVPHGSSVSVDGGLNFLSCDHGQKMPNYSGTAKFSSQTSPLESTKTENFRRGSSSLPQLPCSVHDVKTTKEYTTLDMGEESSRGRPKTSQTTHHLPMSEKKDVDLFDRGQFFRESIIPTKLKGNAFSEIPDFSPPICDNALKSMKLEALGSPMHIEGKENVQDLKTTTSQKNESSAETDTMDINALEEDHLPGDVPLPLNKCPKESQNSPTCQVALSSDRGRNKAQSVNIAAPDINHEPPELHTLTSLVDDRETSTSRTQSLDVEDLFSLAKEHGNSKSNTCGNGSLGPEPISRWVKRLKLCTSGSAHGTKSEKIGETSSHEKVNKIFSKIMKGSKTSSEPKIISLAEEQKVPDLPATVSTNGKSSLVKAKQTLENTLSHPWIQRWSHNRAASSPKKHEPMELRKPQSLDTVMEGFQEKQYPSVAAMALMGKAMGSLHPCEIMKKGPLVVWNTKGL